MSTPPEKIRTLVFDDHAELARVVAARIAALIRDRQSDARPVVLGLATGSTPIGVYRELIRMHRDEGLSFRHVVTFNLDEYWPMQPAELQSYRRFMNEYLFDHIDISPGNTNIPSSSLAMIASAIGVFAAAPNTAAMPTPAAAHLAKLAMRGSSRNSICCHVLWALATAEKMAPMISGRAALKSAQKVSSSRRLLAGISGNTR